MIRFAFLPILALLLLPAAQAADAPPATGNAKCPQLPPEGPKLVFNIQFPEPKFIHTADVPEINELAAKTGLPSHSGKTFNTGLTHGRFEWKLKTGALTYPNQPSPVCAKLGIIELDFGYSSQDVYVASRYAKDSCNYRVTLDHEKQHVAINRRMTEKHGARIKDKLTEFARKSGPYMASDSKAAAAEAKRRVQALLEPMIEEFKRERTKLHAEIDSPEAYRATAANCPRW